MDLKIGKFHSGGSKFKVKLAGQGRTCLTSCPWTTFCAVCEFSASQRTIPTLIKSLPNNILRWSKWKVLVEDILIVSHTKFVLDRLEDIVGKGVSVGYQHFLFFPQCFQMLSSTGLLVVGIVW